MNFIKQIKARQVFESRGYPTIEAEVYLTSGHMGRMQVPAGASKGRHEAWELRDDEPMLYEGKSVGHAVSNVNTSIAKLLSGRSIDDQEKIDQLLIEADGTENKSKLGANAILACSLAIAHASASAMDIPLYRHIANIAGNTENALKIPMPMTNIISGGLHAGKQIEVQDYLAIPNGAKNYQDALQMLFETRVAMKHILKKQNLEWALHADEGGFGPALENNEYALELMVTAFDNANLIPGENMSIALDIASSHFFDESSKTYRLQSENRKLSTADMITMLKGWCEKYPITSIEDGLAEDDWQGWTTLTKELGEKIALVGDDLYTTNVNRIQKGIELQAGNTVLIKMNQVGTLTETIHAVKLAKEHGFKTVISARSSETEDNTLADLAVGLCGDMIKIGSTCSSERLSKYNQLIRIDEALNHPSF